MNKPIAYCGLDCSKCEAYIATKNNDDRLKEKVAKEWSTLNSVEITPSMINCEGCLEEGIKTPFCEKLCPIRLCALKKKTECANCISKSTCHKLKMVIGTNEEAYSRIIGNKN